jgi:hypothetical protein
MNGTTAGRPGRSLKSRSRGWSMKDMHMEQVSGRSDEDSNRNISFALSCIMYSLFQGCVRMHSILIIIILFIQKSRN